MSGESVVKPTPFLALPVFGVAAGAAGAVGLVKGIIDSRVNAAVKRLDEANAMACHRKRLEAQTRQMSREAEKMTAELEKLQQSLLSVEKTGTSTLKWKKGMKPKERSTVNRAFDADSTLDGIVQRLDNMLDSVKGEDAAPWKQLLSIANNLKRRSGRGQLVRPEEIDSLSNTLEKTLKKLKHEKEKTAAQKNAALKSAGELLEEVLLSHYLRCPPRIARQLEQVRSHLEHAIENRECTPGKLSALRRKYMKIKTGLEAWMNNWGLRTGLSQSISRHLAGMGYEIIEPFPTELGENLSTAVLRMPDGECVRAGIQPSGEISFQICHESCDSDERISRDAVTHFSVQEKKWCRDLHELIRKLIAEGYDLNLKMERYINRQSIPVVVVDQPDEIDDEADEGGRNRPNEGEMHLDEGEYG